MSSDLTSILLKLPTLPNESLSKIQAKIKALINGTPVKGSDAQVELVSDDYLLEGIHFELRRRGLLGATMRLHKRRFPSGYHKAAAEVRRLLEQHLPNLKPVEWTSVGMLVARSLADHLESTRRTVSPWGMLSNIHQAPVALDCAYPGYLEAGLLSFCWKQRV